MEKIFIITIIFCIITLLSSFRTCKRYISNTYFYLLTSTLILFSFIKYFNLNSESEIPNIYKNSPILFGLFIIGLFITILYIPSDYLLIKHILWLLFIFTLSIMFYIFIKDYDSDTIKNSGYITLFLFATMTLISLLFKDALRDKEFSWVMTILFVALSLFSFFVQKGSTLSKGISIVIIGILCYSLIIETKDLMIKEQNCINPDYIDASAGFFITIQNIFLRLANLQSDLNNF